MLWRCRMFDDGEFAEIVVFVIEYVVKRCLEWECHVGNGAECCDR
jgi:hypothetical protein